MPFPQAATAPRRVIPIKALSSWSFSRYNTYEQCPAKIKYAVVDRIKEPENDAMRRGSLIHKMCEDFVRGHIDMCPEIEKFAGVLEDLKARYQRGEAVIVEDSWTFRADWTLTHAKDWDGAWLRMKIDSGYELEVEGKQRQRLIDWKTGKVSPYKEAEYALQLDLYAMAAFILKPHIDEVEVLLSYLDHGMFYPAEPVIYTRERDAARLKKEWTNRTKRMLADTRFAPTPSRMCGYCFYSKNSQASGAPRVCQN